MFPQGPKFSALTRTTLFAYESEPLVEADRLVITTRAGMLGNGGGEIN